MGEYLSTQDLRALLKGGGELTLGCDAVAKLVAGVLGKEQPDLQWLYDCAMERGNSEATFYGDPLRLEFSNAGTCTLGIVCEVMFANTVIPQAVLAKYASGESVWPEDLAGVEPSRVAVTYDEFHDEEGDGGEGDDE